MFAVCLYLFVYLCLWFCCSLQCLVFCLVSCLVFLLCLVWLYRLQLIIVSVQCLRVCCCVLLDCVVLSLFVWCFLVGLIAFVVSLAIVSF